MLGKIQPVPEDSDTNPEPADPPAEANGRDAHYGSYYYEHYFAAGGGELAYEPSEHWLTYFDGVAARTSAELEPRSVLDAGCALGMLVGAFRDHGVEAFGTDISEYAVTHADPAVREFLWVGSLGDPLPRRYDLVTCFEVLEHLDAGESARAIKNLCEATDQILFCSTPRDYDEPSHVNVRPQEDWVADFAKEGFLRDLSFDASFVAPWAVLLRRQTKPTAEVVRDYDRHAWRLQAEIDQLRALALRQEQRLERQEGSIDVLRHEEPSREILMTRDELMAARAELGQALGRVAVLEARALRFERAAHELNEFRRAPVWRWYAPYQRTRARLGERVRALLSRIQ
jgi:2-polyprenyl-3-methyl-5-hydroxy-6-metoxy-1,4-benzoquinol methylase